MAINLPAILLFVLLLQLLTPACAAPNIDDSTHAQNASFDQVPSEEEIDALWKRVQGNAGARYIEISFASDSVDDSADTNPVDDRLSHALSAIGLHAPTARLGATEIEIVDVDGTIRALPAAHRNGEIAIVAPAVKPTLLSGKLVRSLSISIPIPTVHLAEPRDFNIPFLWRDAPLTRNAEEASLRVSTSPTAAVKISVFLADGSVEELRGKVVREGQVNARSLKISRTAFSTVSPQVHSAARC